jgi:hypothetical protein
MTTRLATTPSVFREFIQEIIHASASFLFPPSVFGLLSEIEIKLTLPTQPFGGKVRIAF